MKLRGYFFGCLSSATYGLIPLFALPILHKGVATETLLFYRFTAATIFLALIMLVKGESLKVTKEEAKSLLLPGILFAISSQFLFWGYDFMAAGIVATILFIYPVFVAILMFLLFREKISWIAQLAILLALTGVVLLYEGDGRGTLNPVGVGIVLVSALSYALYMIVVNKSHAKDINGGKLTLYGLLICALFFFGKSLFRGNLELLPDTESVVNLLLLASVPTVVSSVALVYAIHYVGSTATAVLGAMEPVVAVIIGVTVFHESLTFSLTVGIILIITAVTLIVLSDYIHMAYDKSRHRNKRKRAV